MRKGWEIKKLGDVCSKITDGSHNPPKGIEVSEFLMLSSKNIFDDSISYNSPRFLTEKDFDNENKRTDVNSNDVLLTIVGTIGRVAVVPQNHKKFTLQRSVAVLKPKSNISPRFLMFGLQNKLAFLVNESRGVAQKGLYLNQINNISIEIPPLSEQQRIVTILDEAFEAIDQAKANTERNRQNARELFESYLQGMFDSKIHGTKSETLESLCDLIVDCEHKTAPTQETGYPSIRTPNVGKGYLILDGVYRVSYETYQEWTRRAVPKAGDLILAREAPAGNIAVIPDNLEVCLGQRTVLIRPKKERFVSMYLAYLILSKEVQQRLLSHSHGATVEHVNMKDIRAFKIYNLSSVEEQQRVVDQINVFQSEATRLEANYLKKLESLEELKKSILQKAFSGELTRETTEIQMEQLDMVAEEQAMYNPNQ